MSDNKRKTFVVPAPKATVKAKRSSSANMPTTSRASSRVPQTAIKARNPAQRAEINKNTTVLGDGDVTLNSQESLIPEFEEADRQIAYGKFLRAMLEDCLVNEKIEREETEIDLQMTQLARRFEMTMDQLDKTNRRMKEISFVVEQKRLLDLKNNDTSQFYEITEQADTETILKDLTEKEQASLNQLKTKNVDFGYDKDSGHQQLLDALNDAVIGLEDIKKHSKLDDSKFAEYDKSEGNLKDIGKDQMDLEGLKKVFEEKFPNFSEKLLKETSDKIAKFMEDDHDGDE